MKRNDSKKVKNNNSNDLRNVIVGALISALVSISISNWTLNQSISMTNNQIADSNKPILGLNNFSDIDLTKDFIIVYSKWYNEYTILQTIDLNSIYSVTPLNLRLSNIGKGTLLDLKFYSLYNEVQPSIIDKIKIAEKLQDLYNLKKSDLGAFETTYKNISPINIVNSNCIDKKFLLLHRQKYYKDISMFNSTCYAICFYHDINDKVYKALLEIDYELPINDDELLLNNNDDSRRILSCGIFQDNSIDFNNIVECNEKLKSEINKYYYDYINGLNSTN